MSDAEQEEELIRKALSKVNEIRAIRNERRIQVIICNIRGTIMCILKTILSFKKQLSCGVAG